MINPQGLINQGVLDKLLIIYLYSYLLLNTERII